jgi:hypothetical protein
MERTAALSNKTDETAWPHYVIHRDGAIMVVIRRELSGRKLSNEHPTSENMVWRDHPSVTPVQLSSEGFVALCLQNWKRFKGRFSEKLVGLHAPERAQPLPESGPEVLSTYQGFVQDVADGIAYVTLVSKDGTTFDGQYPLEKLQGLGIGDKEAFECDFVKLQKGGYDFILKAIADEDTPLEDQVRLWRELEGASK